MYGNHHFFTAFTQVSSSIFSLHRDVKGVSDAQERLVRVIEDVSQELKMLKRRCETAGGKETVGSLLTSSH